MTDGMKFSDLIFTKTLKIQNTIFLFCFSVNHSWVKMEDGKAVRLGERERVI